jgi:hypothetical protein
MKQDEPKAPAAIHGPFSLNYRPVEKANVTAACLENLFIPQDLCDKNCMMGGG